MSLAPLLLAISGLAFGCSSDDDAIDGGAAPLDAGDAGEGERVRVLVGELTDTDVKLGVIAAGDKARLFFCGGPDTVEDMTRWVVAEVDQNSAFELEVDDWKISGQLEALSLAGELEQEGEETAEFVAKLIDPDTVAGVYEAVDDQCGKVGLIVTQPSQNDVATAQGACVGPGHLPEQVNPILPITLEDDGTIAVELEGDEGPRAAKVLAAAPPM
jgi:hypothetical protein